MAAKTVSSPNCYQLVELKEQEIVSGMKGTLPLKKVGVHSGIRRNESWCCKGRGCTCTFRKDSPI